MCGSALVQYCLFFVCYAKCIWHSFANASFCTRCLMHPCMQNELTPLAKMHKNRKNEHQNLRFCIVFLLICLKSLYFAPRKRERQKEYINLKVKNMSEIEVKVKEIIVDKLGVDEADVVPEASFTNDLGADSLDTVELIMEFEKTFDITIPDDKAEKISTVADAIAFIEGNK